MTSLSLSLSQITIFMAVIFVIEGVYTLICYPSQ